MYFHLLIFSIQLLLLLINDDHSVLSIIIIRPLRTEYWVTYSEFTGGLFEQSNTMTVIRTQKINRPGSGTTELSHSEHNWSALCSDDRSPVIIITQNGVLQTNYGTPCAQSCIEIQSMNDTAAILLIQNYY